MHSYVWIDVVETLGQDLHLGTTESRMRSGQLTVDIGGLHGICIDKSQCSHPSTAQHFSSIGPYPTNAYHEHMGIAQAQHLILAKQ